ncbi:MAG TPA: class I SAM-dependent methyltransferase [Microlunatus sp.]
MDDITLDPILQIASGFMAAKFLFVANEFGVFDALKDNPTDLAGLAARAGLAERSARILADGCVALGLLHKQGGIYTNSPHADRFLTGGGLSAGLRFWDVLSYPAWAHFAATLAHGPSQQAVELPPEVQQIMLAGIESMLAGPTQVLAATVDLGCRHRLLDLGCGTGSWSTALLRANQQLTATLVDLPIAIGATEKHVAGTGLADRVTVRGADIRSDPIPTGHDVVMINNVIHYFSPEDNRGLLARVSDVVSPGALLIAADFWTDPTHTEPVPAALMAGEFAAHIAEGDVYSLDEITSWLEVTGWEVDRHQSLAGPQSAVLARRT